MYPGQQGGYPPQQPGQYPPQQPGQYPPQGYPPQQPGQYPSQPYPGQQGYSSPQLGQQVYGNQQQTPGAPYYPPPNPAYAPQTYSPTTAGYPPQTYPPAGQYSQLSYTSTPAVVGVVTPAPYVVTPAVVTPVVVSSPSPSSSSGWGANYPGASSTSSGSVAPGWGANFPGNTSSSCSHGSGSAATSLNGHYTITNVLTRMALDGNVSGGGAPRQFEDRHKKPYMWQLNSGATNHQWLLQNCANGYYNIISRANNLALDGNVSNHVPQFDFSHKAPFLWSCSPQSANHQWEFRKIGHDTYLIINKESGLALDGNTAAAMQYVTSHPMPFSAPLSPSSPAQQWTIRRV